jgi:hypothetical protein
MKPMQPNTTPIMPFVILILLLLPVRLAKAQMKGLAFFLWLTGGSILFFRGIGYLLASPEHTNAPLLAIVAALALAIGFGKGKFVLSKTSRRNIERIDQFTEPKKPIHVYSVKSWLIIGLMVGISVALTVFNTPMLWRGGINLGIGFGLIISSLAYLKALSPATKLEAPTP